MTEKKYYWLKLKRDFFKRHDIRIIEDMENGEKYLLFYMKLLVESIDHEGSLRFSDTIPYNEKMLSTITNTDIDIVRTAVKVFAELGMMDQLDDGTLYMNQVKSMVGAETEWAEKKRIYRQAKQIESKTLSGQKKTLSDKSKSIEKEIEIDNTPEEQTKNGADAQNVFNYYYGKYQSSYNEKPVCNVGRFIKQIKSMLDSSSPDELMGMIDYIWNDSFVSSAGHSPETVFTGSSVGKFRARIKQAEPERVEKKHTCEHCGSVYTDFCRNPDCPGYK